MDKDFTSEDGFTLVETLASLVLVVIILLCFSQLFVQTKNTASINNEKLVVINLADAVLEGLKVKPMKEIPSISNVQDYFTTTINPNAPTNEISFNGKEYSISYLASQKSEKFNNGYNSEKELEIIDVVVTVTSPDGKTKSSSEGYVSIE